MSNFVRNLNAFFNDKQLTIKPLTMKYRLLLAFPILTFCLLQTACVPPEYRREKYEGITLDFADRQVQEIYNLLERQSADSLLHYLSHPNPTYRYIAATAFGSLKDTLALDTLGKLLHDEFTDVRIAAAYSLGQLGNRRAEPLLLAAYESRDTAGIFKKFNATILEAVVKEIGHDSRTYGALWMSRVFRPETYPLCNGLASSCRVRVCDLIALDLEP